MDVENTEGTESFSVRLILAETLAFCAVNKSYLYDSLKYLFLGVLANSIVSAFGLKISGWIFFASFICQIYLDTLMTVKCHRMFLLKEPVGTLKDAFSWEKRESIFIVKGVKLSLLMGIIIFPVVFFISILTQPQTTGSGIAFYIQIIMIPVGYMCARLSLVFPAIAIDKEFSFSDAWKMSEGNGWKLLFMIYFLPWGLYFIFGSIFSGYMILGWIYSLVAVVVLVFEVLVLSNSYQHLSRIRKISAMPQEG